LSLRYTYMPLRLPVAVTSVTGPMARTIDAAL
jgi:hypothetical protein